MLKNKLYKDKFAEVMQENVYLSKLNTESPNLTTLGLDSTHCSSELQKLLTGEGQVCKEDDISFIISTTIKMID